MANTFVAIGFGALIALSPLAAIAQTDGAAQPMQVAQAAPATPNSAHAERDGAVIASVSRSNPERRALYVPWIASSLPSPH